MKNDATLISLYAVKINGSWHKAKHEILETARYCSDAQRELDASGKAELMAKLPFGAPTFSKLATIGNNPKFREPKFRKLLPSHYSIMYELAILDPEDLDAAVAAGLVHPDCRRTEIIDWIESRKNPDSDQPSEHDESQQLGAEPNLGTDKGRSRTSWAHRTSNGRALPRSTRFASPAQRFFKGAFAVIYPGDEITEDARIEMHDGLEKLGTELGFKIVYAPRSTSQALRGNASAAPKGVHCAIS